MGDQAEKTGLQAFEARLALLAEKVRAGFPERARELRRAVAALPQDLPVTRDEIRRFAHKIRGTAGSHGFAELSEIAAKVERLAHAGAAEETAREALALADALDRTALDRAAQAAVAPAPSPISEVQPEAPAEPISEVQQKVVSLAGLRILVVDDDASTRKLLSLTLVNVGRAEAIIEERGALMIERLRAERFDVVIVDAMMPEMNGSACLERIVGDALHRQGTRYFVLSAATEQELGWSLPQELDVGWLRKPFRPRELVDAIAARLAR